MNNVPQHEHNGPEGCLIALLGMLVLLIMEVTWSALEIIKPGVVVEAAKQVLPFLYK